MTNTVKSLLESRGFSASDLLMTGGSQVYYRSHGEEQIRVFVHHWPVPEIHSYRCSSQRPIWQAFHLKELVNLGILGSDDLVIIRLQGYHCLP